MQHVKSILRFVLACCVLNGGSVGAETFFDKWQRYGGSTDVQKPLKKSVIPPTQLQDEIPPVIDIAGSITVDTASAVIEGRVTDNESNVRIIVEGRPIDHISGGSFSFKRYVPPGGTSVRIQAIDDWGNRSVKIVVIKRSKIELKNQINFDELDPTKVAGMVNLNAVALVLGVANYIRAPDAIYADSDAAVFSDYAHKAMGVPRSRIKVLLNDAASNTDIKITIKQWLRGRIDEGRTDVFVFYAGHGLASIDGEDLFLLPYDGVPNLLEDTSLKRSDLFEVIAEAKPRSTTVFLDTCYSGAGRKEETLLANARPILISPKKQSMPNGFTVLSAASGRQISSSLDEAKHGLFSYYLMKGMEGPADANSDRQITAGELHEYLRRKVKRQANRLGREQQPELQGDPQRVLVSW
jgi:hypothetical protein